MFCLQERGKHLALAADLHFFLPVLLGFALANGAIDEPAELACLKFPGWTVLFTVSRTFFDGPAGFWSFIFAMASAGKQEKNLPFDMGGNRAPALLIAVYGLNRCP